MASTNGKKETTNRWAQLLASDDLSTGFFCFIGDERIIEIAGYAGMDFVIFDTEHASYGLDFIERGIRAAKSVDLVTVVRMPGGEPDPNLITRLLDAGIDGIMFARVTTKESVEHLVKLCKLEPEGLRGACPGARAGHFALMPIEEYRRRASDVAIMVMIENKVAFDAANDIMAIPGVAGVTVGRDDLAESLGGKEGRNDPIVVEAEREIMRLAKVHGIGYRGSAKDAEELKQYVGKDNCPRTFSFLTDSFQIGSRFRDLVTRSHDALD
jgi:4-hydroxy-2-oxoheptanedioate aldolase